MLGGHHRPRSRRWWPSRVQALTPACRVAALACDALLDPVAERGQAAFDAERLAGHPAEEDAAEHIERVCVAPRERQIDAEHQDDEAQAVEHALLNALREPAARQHADKRPGQDRGDVDERPGQGPGP